MMVLDKPSTWTCVEASSKVENHGFESLDDLLNYEFGPRDTKCVHWWTQFCGLDSESYPALFDKHCNYGQCHPMDPEASGALIISLTHPVWESLRLCYWRRYVRELYVCLVHGRLDKEPQTVKHNIIFEEGKSRLSVKGKQARTHIKALGFFSRTGADGKLDEYTLCTCEVAEGHKHQSRIHLSEGLGCPVVGDAAYLPAEKKDASVGLCPRVFLHSYIVGFPGFNGEILGESETGEEQTLPVDHDGLEWNCVVCPLPQDLRDVLLKLDPDDEDSSQLHECVCNRGMLDDSHDSITVLGSEERDRNIDLVHFPFQRDMNVIECDTSSPGDNVQKHEDDHVLSPGDNLQKHLDDDVLNHKDHDSSDKRLPIEFPSLLSESDHLLVVLKPSDWICSASDVDKKKGRELDPNEKLEFKGFRTLDDLLSCNFRAREKKFVHWWLQLSYNRDEPSYPILFDEDQNYGLCHRLDRETSGGLLVSLNPVTREQVRSCFHRRYIRQSYVALVHGHVRPSVQTIDRNIEAMGQKARLEPHRGRRALTHLKVLGHFRGCGPAGKGDYSLCSLELLHSRMHQCRVHLAQAIDSPIVGEFYYQDGKQTTADRTWCPRLFLHTYALGFPDVSGDVPRIPSGWKTMAEEDLRIVDSDQQEWHCVVVPFPRDLSRALSYLEPIDRESAQLHDCIKEHGLLNADHKNCHATGLEERDRLIDGRFFPCQHAANPLPGSLHVDRCEEEDGGVEVNGKGLAQSGRLHQNSSPRGDASNIVHRDTKRPKQDRHRVDDFAGSRRRSRSLRGPVRPTSPPRRAYSRSRRGSRARSPSLRRPPMRRRRSRSPRGAPRGRRAERSPLPRHRGVSRSPLPRHRGAERSPLRRHRR